MLSVHVRKTKCHEVIIQARTGTVITNFKKFQGIQCFPRLTVSYYVPTQIIFLSQIASLTTDQMPILTFSSDWIVEYNFVNFL